MENNIKGKRNNNKYQKISYSEVDLLFASKINELIDEINKLKRDKE